jgi:hypothetical protein
MNMDFGNNSAGSFNGANFMWIGGDEGVSALPVKLSSKWTKYFVVTLFSYRQATSKAWDDEHFTQLECCKRNLSAQGSEVVFVGPRDLLDQAMFS